MISELIKSLGIQKKDAFEIYWSGGTEAATLRAFHEVVAYNTIFEDLVSSLFRRCDSKQLGTLTALLHSPDCSRERIYNFINEQGILLCPHRLKLWSVLVRICPSFRGGNLPRNSRMIKQLMDLMGLKRRKTGRLTLLISMSLREGTDPAKTAEFLEKWVKQRDGN